MNNTIYIFAWANNPQRAKLKGRPCKLLATGALNSCEVVFVDTGQHEIVSHRALRTIKCVSCGQPLIEIDANRGYCVRLCNNFHCRLYGERQGLRERSEQEGEAYRQRRWSRIFMATTGGDGRCKEQSPERRLDMDRRKARPGYQLWMEQKKQNYHTLKDLGYGSQEAMANSSKKRMRELGINAEMPKRAN